ncbi:MAG: energy transducer TonB [Rhodospirillaceae bacterium]
MRKDAAPVRWFASLGVAALGHGMVVLAGLSWAADPPSASGAPVFAVEVAAAPPAPAQVAEPAPLPEVRPAAPPKPVTDAVPLPHPKPPAPKPKPHPKPMPEPVPSPAASSAPPSASVIEPNAKITAAPVPGANAQAAPARASSWQGELLGRLEQFKRYPRSAQWNRRQGTVIVAFAIDREGRVLTKRLSRSSGFADLDAEALELLNRAQPLPPPPERIAGDRIELVVPVQFYLKR